MSKYYVMTDIHGRIDVLEMALSFLYDREPEGGKVIFLGDYIDRGQDSVGVLLTVMSPPPGWEFVCLKGNHEEMLLCGEIYDPKSASPIFEHPDGQAIIDWMIRLPLRHKIGKNVFVHAGYDGRASWEDQADHVTLWWRPTILNHEIETDEGFFIIHGHTPTINPDTNGPHMTRTRLNMDIGGVFTGRFAVAEFEESDGVAKPTQFHFFEGVPLEDL